MRTTMTTMTIRQQRGGQLPDSPPPPKRATDSILRTGRQHPALTPVSIRILTATSVSRHLARYTCGEKREHAGRGCHLAGQLGSLYSFQRAQRPHSSGVHQL